MGKLFQSALDWSEVWALLIPLFVLLFKRQRPRFLKPVIIYLWLALAINVVIDMIWVYKRYFPDWLQSNNPYYNKNVREDIDGVSISHLTEKYGSPLYVFSERKLREKFKSIYDAFSTRYPNVVYGWSYKTNYLQAICAILHQENAIAEVVSGFEYEKARKLGIKGKDIIFNGPHKGYKALV